MYHIFHVLMDFHNRGVEVAGLWVPAHAGDEWKKIAALLAMNALKLQEKIQKHC